MPEVASTARLTLTRYLEAVAFLLSKRQDLADALVLAGTIRTLHASMDTVSISPYWIRFDESIVAARQMLGKVDADAADAEGQEMTLEEAVAFAREALA